ncbi:transposase [Cryobacterium sp. BB307]|uniref:transposase n=1 Tax=Cryobacterium sp. BB307 TaxID=2716317 RepID=UPI001447D1F0|nr:transposase [Cryobacterium sp. BB307]
MTPSRDAIAEVARELYALPPDAFTAARNDRAKADPAIGKEVKAFKKPSVAAWAVNLLAARRGDELEQVLALGAALREAQDDLDAKSLRELTRQRRQVIAALGRAAAELAEEAGHPISGATRDEVEQTLQAGLAEPAAAAAVRSGRLVRALAFAGLESVDLSGAVAGGEPDAPAAPARKPSAGAAAAKPVKRLKDQARKKAEEAEAAAREVQDELDRLEGEADEALAARDRLEAQREELIARLDQLEEQLASSARDATTLQHRRERAERDAERAAAAADRARERAAEFD